MMRNATVVSVRSSVPHQRLIETGGPEEGPSPSYNGRIRCNTNKCNNFNIIYYILL